MGDEALVRLVSRLAGQAADAAPVDWGVLGAFVATVVGAVLALRALVWCVHRREGARRV